MVEYGYQHLEGKRAKLFKDAVQRYHRLEDVGMFKTYVHPDSSHQENFARGEYLHCLHYLVSAGQTLLITHEVKDRLTLKLSRNYWIHQLRVAEIDVDKSLVEAVK